MEINATFPDALSFLFEPSRFKVAYGGRGSSKSWSYARALLITGTQQPLRILCAREIQKSIKQSVHTLLCDQIQALGLGEFYQPLETEIRGANGTSIMFAGLASHTVDSIKSYEGVDRVWVEEGQTVSKRSWDVLIPTIRKPGSEIWVTFNPELDTDDTYQRFVVNPPPDCRLAQVNYSDNPWFPPELEQERLHCEATRPDDYRTIWEGECRSAVSGAIYAREYDQMVREGRVTNCPYDPRLKVYAVWDLGWNDSTAIIIAQRVRSELRVIDYIEDSFKTLDHYAGMLKAMPYNWGCDFLPHDGFHGDYKTGRSAAEILKAFGRKVKQTPSTSIENGIKAARMLLGQTVMDKAKTTRLQDCIRRYRRAISTNGEPGAPVHDEYSHGADVVRYTALTVEQMTNEDERPMPRVQEFRPSVQGMGYL